MAINFPAPIGNLQPSNVAPLATAASLASGVIHTETLTIVTQNVIPPLSQPFGGAAVNTFGQLAINRLVFEMGDPGVTFTVGSPIVSVSPNILGFNINPGDLVVATYAAAT